MQMQMQADIYRAARGGYINPILDLTRTSELLSSHRSIGGNSIFHIHLSIQFEQRHACPTFMKEIIDKDDSLLDVTNVDGETPIFTAAKFGQYEAAKIIIEHRGSRSYLSQVNKDGDTPLLSAVRNGSAEVVRELLTALLIHGDTSIYISNKKSHETVLLLAAKSGSEKTVHLISQAIVYNQDYPLMLHEAVQYNLPDLVDKLLTHCKDLVERTDSEGRTAFHYAAKLDTTNILRILLLKFHSPSAAVFIQDKKGITAAHIAAQCNNVEGLKKLVSHSPDCCETSDDNGWNVVHYAAKHSCPETLIYLLENEHFGNLVDKKDKDGNTPFHLLAFSIKDLPKTSARCVWSHIRSCNIPLLNKTQMNIRNNDNVTPGDIVRSYNSFELGSEQLKLAKEIEKVYSNGECVINIPEERSKSEEAEVTYCKRKLKKAHGLLFLPALIATLSLTFALAVPGGFNQNQSDPIKGGTAILLHKPAFKIFFAFDMLAFTTSFLALIFCFLAVATNGKWMADPLLKFSLIATAISVFASVVVVIAGVYSIL